MVVLWGMWGYPQGVGVDTFAAGLRGEMRGSLRSAARCAAPVEMTWLVGCGGQQVPPLRYGMEMQRWADGVCLFTPGIYAAADKMRGFFAALRMTD